MSKFKHLTEEAIESDKKAGELTAQEQILLEIAHQLKRVADSLKRLER